MRGTSAIAAGQARREGGFAIGVGGGFAEDFVVDGDEPDFGIGDRLGAGERAREGMDAVLARDGRQPEVGNDEPLRREIVANRPGS